jgi:hypothetical protein
MKFKKYLAITPNLRLVIEKAQRNPVAYHGSYETGSKKFKTARRWTETGIRILGAYFTDNPKMAVSFGPNLYKVQLQFRKLIDLTRWKPLMADEDFIEAIPELSQEEIDHYFKHSYYGTDSAYHVIETLDQKHDLLKRWKKRGYDGVAFQESHFGEKGITYVPFNKNQIKVLEIPDK